MTSTQFMEFSSRAMRRKPIALKSRNLGSAIFLVAIEDYRSLRAEPHQSAAQFLYPATPEAQERYDWAMGLVEGLDPAWLRDALDRFRRTWDAQRCARMKRPSRRARKKEEPAYDLGRCS